MPGQTIVMLYEERRPLYEKYADIVVSTAGMTPDQVVALVLRGGGNAFRSGVKFRLFFFSRSDIAHIDHDFFFSDEPQFLSGNGLYIGRVFR